MEMPKKLRLLIFINSVVCIVLYMIYSGIVYLAHLDNVPDVALLTLPPTNKFYAAIQGLYAIGSILAYPL